ncbi:E6 [Canine papillomavirus 22]|uniref:E6 n=1 Tax=Canine papillomavirus 22 TaxID=2304620 RepID=UPI000E358B51|nr:E6 [Canine papillomavirus 22]AXQ03954.1 E6 [Canine papillomavirus 22]
MAAPATLTELSVACRRPADVLPVPCIFCGCFLTLDDKKAFERKALKLIWKQRVPFGTCSKCCAERAQADCVEHTRCTLEGEGVRIFAGTHLGEVIVRCRCCLGLLSLREKLEAEERREPFLLVRRCWRNTCKDCLLKQE